MQVVQIKTSALKPYDKNAKKHDKAQIDNVAQSITDFGFVQPIVVDADNVVIIGHCRLEAAKKLKLKEVPCVIADSLSPEDVRRLRLLDNKLNESDWDIDLLNDDLFGLDFDDYDIDWLGGEDTLSEEEAEPQEDDFDVEDEIEKPTMTHKGDVWQLGQHRLVCGDSTLQADVERLMNGDKAELFLTDPPYNVDYVGKTKDALKIQNDAMSDDDFRLFLETAFSNASEAMSKGAAAYIFHANGKTAEFIEAFRTAGFLYKQMLIWVKNTMVLGRQDYQWKHEPCIYGWKDGATHYFVDDRTQTTVINEDKPLRSELHPTMKPIKLLARLIKNSSRVGDIVLDLFGGSGSTLIACEQLNRVCYTMELDEKYCDVIVNRFIAQTGTDYNVSVERDGKVYQYSDIAKGADDDNTR